MRYGSVCSGIEACTMGWHHLKWEPAFFSEIDDFPRAVLQYHYPQVPLHGDFTTVGADDYGSIDLLVGGTPANPSQLQDLEEEWQMSAVTWRSNILNWLREKGPDGWFGERPRVLSSNGGRDFGAFLGAWSSAGMGSPTECLTLNTSEWPKDAAVCSLSDTLETETCRSGSF